MTKRELNRLKKQFYSDMYNPMNTMMNWEHLFGDRNIIEQLFGHRTYTEEEFKEDIVDYIWDYFEYRLKAKKNDTSVVKNKKKVGIGLKQNLNKK